MNNSKQVEPFTAPELTLTWVDKLLGLFGVIRYSKHTEALDTLLDSANSWMCEYEELSARQYDESNRAIKKLTDRLSDIEICTMDEYRLKNERLLAENEEIRNSVENQKEINMDIRKSLYGALNSSGTYSFPRSRSIPGSTVIEPTTSPDNDKISFIGRILLDDNTTMKIGQCKTIREEYNVIVQHIIRYGAIDMISKSLLNSGAIQLSIGYNDDCCTYAVYLNSDFNMPDDVFLVGCDDSLTKTKSTNEE